MTLKAITRGLPGRCGDPTCCRRSGWDVRGRWSRGSRPARGSYLYEDDDDRCRWGPDMAASGGRVRGRRFLCSAFRTTLSTNLLQLATPYTTSSARTTFQSSRATTVTHLTRYFLSPSARLVEPSMVTSTATKAAPANRRASGGDPISGKATARKSTGGKAPKKTLPTTNRQP